MITFTLSDKESARRQNAQVKLLRICNRIDWKILQRILEEVQGVISKCIQQTICQLHWSATCLNKYTAIRGSAVEVCRSTRTRGYTRPDPYPRVLVGLGRCLTGWVGCDVHGYGYTRFYRQGTRFLRFSSENFFISACFLNYLWWSNNLQYGTWKQYSIGSL